jgi:uncharacterized protein YjaZ
MMSFNLAEYIAMEGLAESFASAIYGEDMVGLYVTYISDEDLEKARILIGAALDVTGFDKLRGYVFGGSSTDQYGFEAVGGMPECGAEVPDECTSCFEVVRMSSFLDTAGGSESIRGCSES